jgi:hypothetical protein
MVWYTGAVVAAPYISPLREMCSHDKFVRLYLNGELIAWCDAYAASMDEIEALADSLFLGARSMRLVREDQLHDVSNIIDNKHWIGRKPTQ